MDDRHEMVTSLAVAWVEAAKSYSTQPVYSFAEA
jgi:hypothetical protein